MTTSLSQARDTKHVWLKDDMPVGVRCHCLVQVAQQLQLYIETLCAVSSYSLGGCRGVRTQEKGNHRPKHKLGCIHVCAVSGCRHSGGAKDTGPGHRFNLELATIAVLLLMAWHSLVKGVVRSLPCSKFRRPHPTNYHIYAL